jgi:hypothetical protein
MKVKTNVKAGQVDVDNVVNFDFVDDSTNVGVGVGGIGVGQINQTSTD